MKPTCVDDETWRVYKNNWVTIENPSSTHLAIAKRLAETRTLVVKTRGGKAEWNNFAAFGLSVVDVDGKSISEIFPRLLFSAYNVPEHIPVVDSSGEALIAIPDMFRGDMMHRATQSERVLDFFCWLASNHYTKIWNINQLIATQSALVASKEAAKMAILPDSELSQSLLHCEQVLLYAILKDDSLIRDLVSRLITRENAFEILISKDSIITFDIVTYNDMCPKCFSTCYHLQKTLEMNINRILFEELRKLGKLIDFSKRADFPVNVQIQISSFRPFLIMDNLVTRGEKGMQSYAEYSTLKLPGNRSYSRELPVVQFFNPFIAQYIFNCQFDDFVVSIEKLGGGEFRDTWKLSEKFGQLSGSIESDIKNEMAAKLISKKAIFSRSDVCCSILGFSIDLACQITANHDAYYGFVRDLAANANVDNAQLLKLIEHLRNISKNEIIDAAINDQQMLVNTFNLLDNSVPERGRYNFNVMAQAAGKIVLTDVHQVIVGFITSKVSDIYEEIKGRHPPFNLKEAFKKLGVKIID
jgi:hypothetical protein